MDSKSAGLRILPGKIYRIPDSGFHKQRSLRFRIPQAKISRFRIAGHKQRSLRFEYSGANIFGLRKSHFNRSIIALKKAPENFKDLKCVKMVDTDSTKSIILEV